MTDYAEDLPAYPDEKPVCQWLLYNLISLNIDLII